MALPIYQAGQASAYVQSKGWQYKSSGDQLVMDCIFCGRKQKMYINDKTGLWDCKAASCNQKGNFYQLAKNMGDTEQIKPIRVQPKTEPKQHYTLANMAAYKATLESDKDAQDYIIARGLTLDTARAWHLGVKVDRNNVKWLLMPYVQGDQVLDVKYRTLPPTEKRFQRLGGGESILYGQHLMDGRVKKDARVLYMVEGEADCMTMWQQGFSPVVSTTTGAGAFKTAWYDTIAEYDPAKIVICYDSDIAGQNAAEKHVKKFEAEGRRVVNVVLQDAKDANEYFLKHTKAEFEALVTDAPEQEIESCQSMAAVLDRLEEQLWFSTDHFDGLPSQFSDINAMIAGGYWNGQLVTLSGTSGTGKTTFALQELFGFAKQGIPSYLLCLEMPMTMMLRKLIEKEFGIPMLKITQEHVQRYRPELLKHPFFFGDKGSNLDEVEATIRAAVKRYDLKCVAFDNLNYFVRSVDNVNHEIARVTKRMKELAIDLHIPILMIAQPRKFDEDARAMNMSDLKDSSAIAQDSDTIILLYRKRIKTDIKDFGAAKAFQGNQSPYTLVRVDKARYSAGGETFLYFEGARSTYRELTPGEMESLKTH